MQSAGCDLRYLLDDEKAVAVNKLIKNLQITARCGNKEKTYTVRQLHWSDAGFLFPEKHIKKGDENHVREEDIRKISVKQCVPVILFSVAVIAKPTLMSPRKLFIFNIKKYICRIKVSKN